MTTLSVTAEGSYATTNPRTSKNSLTLQDARGVQCGTKRRKVLLLRSLTRPTHEKLRLCLTELQSALLMIELKHPFRIIFNGELLSTSADQ